MDPPSKHTRRISEKIYKMQGYGPLHESSDIGGSASTARLAGHQDGETCGASGFSDAVTLNCEIEGKSGGEELDDGALLHRAE